MQRWIGICGLIVLICLATTFFLSRSRSDLLFPALEAQIDSVRQIEITSTESRIVIDQAADGDWKISSAAGVKAKRQKVRQFLLALSTAKMLDVKSADPARWPEMGLGPHESRIALRSGAMAPLVDLRVGKERTGRALDTDSATPNAITYFARLGNGGSAFVMSDIPEVPKDSAAWADVTMPSIDPADIALMTLTGANLVQVKLAKQAPQMKPVLVDIGKAEALNEAHAHDALSALRGIEPIDVADANNINWFNAKTIYVRTYGGLIVSGQVISRNGESWLRMNGSAQDGAPEKVKKAAEQINTIRALAIRISPEKAALLTSSREQFILR